MNPQARSHLWVLLAFVLAAILVTWPLAARLSDGVPHGGDAFQFIWNGWWVSKALADPAQSLWWTPYQYAPDGASLALHDLSPLNAYFMAWLRATIDDFAAYNILVLLHYILGAWGAYILAWYLTGNRPASMVAGVIFGFSTHHAMHLSQLSTVSSGWLPLSVYYLLKYTRDGGNRDSVLAFLMLLAAALSSWYHLVFAGVVFFGLMIIGSVGRGSLWEHLGGKERWQRALIVWIAAILVLSPLLIMAWREAATLPTEWLVEMGKLYFLDPLWAVLPSPNHPILGAITRPLMSTIPGNTTEGVATLGFVAILLGIAAWFRRNATTRAWCWLELLLFLLALGPTLTVLGNSLHIPGPFRLWAMIPGLNLVRVPARFVGPFTLALAIAAAGWLAGLGPHWRTGWRRAVILWVIPILILFETTVVPIPIVGEGLRHPALERLGEIYTDATGDPNPPDLIVNFPVLPERRQFLFQQTIHQIPTVDGALSNPPPGARDFLLNFNWNPEYLQSIGVDLVLYHPWAARTSLGEFFYIGEEKVPPLEFFKDVMGYEVAYEDERLIVFVP